MNRFLVLTALLLVSLAGRLSAQNPVPWHDPSPHKVQFVTVDENVRLEVLDWGWYGAASRFARRPRKYGSYLR
jgi:hypothetical protein